MSGCVLIVSSSGSDQGKGSADHDGQVHVAVPRDGEDDVEPIAQDLPERGDVGGQRVVRPVHLVQAHVRGAGDVEHGGQHVEEFVAVVLEHAGQLAVVHRVVHAASRQHAEGTAEAGGAGEVDDGDRGHGQLVRDVDGNEVVR